jgi:glycogen operon protein
VRDLATRLAGSSDLFQHDGRGPAASVNFITAHDGFTLRDLVTYNSKHNEANGEGNRDGSDDNRSWNCGIEGETSDAAINALRRRQIRNLLFTLLTATGVPMLTAGDELGRTQRGNNNAYCQNSSISWLDWEEATAWDDVTSLLSALTALRATNPLFTPQHYDARIERWFGADGQELDTTAWGDPNRRTLGRYLADAENAFLAWYHADSVPIQVTLPADSGTLEVVVSTAAPGELPEDTLSHGNIFILPPRTAVLLRANRLA